jgi:hypothetical protein
MKKILLALLSVAFLSAGAQTVEDVIQKYAANLGGLAAFNNIKSIKMTGTVTTQGMDLPLTTQVINGRAMRTDVEVMGSQIISVYKDGKGWKQNAFAGAATPTEATAAELVDLKQQSMLASTLMDYKARGHQVALDGQADVEGIKTYKIKLTNKDDGKVTNYYISTTDYLLIKSESEREMQGQSVNIETYYSDLKDFNGTKFYLTRTQKIEGQEFQTIKFDKLELNVAIDEKVFDMPK